MNAAKHLTLYKRVQISDENNTVKLHVLTKYQKLESQTVKNSFENFNTFEQC